MLGMRGHLSDAALEWLVDNKIIEPKQRGDAVAILRSISVGPSKPAVRSPLENGSNALHGIQRQQ